MRPSIHDILAREERHYTPAYLAVMFTVAILALALGAGALASQTATHTKLLFILVIVPALAGLVRETGNRYG